MHNNNIYIKNRQAFFQYNIEDSIKAGIVLTGSEIKAIRNGKVSFNDAYCFFHKQELWIKCLYIGEYNHAGYSVHVTTRDRKLLITKKEIKKWLSKIKEKGFTIIPMSIFTNERGYAKIEIGLGRGKKLFDKRETIKNRDAERHIKRFLKR